MYKIFKVMEFGRYFSGSYVEATGLTAFWPYPATISGNFSGNHPTGVSPTTQGILVTDGGNDFSLFLTVETLVVTTSNLQFRTQLLASNSNGTTGWDFGILASNSLFVHANNGETYVFDQIHLGSKNCICLQKSGSSFTVYKYDIWSTEIESEQTIFFNDSADLSGPNIKVGYNASTNLGATYYSWYGTVDQLALIMEPLDRATIKSLFAGFEPKTITVNTTYSDYLLDSTLRPSDTSSIYLDLVNPIIANVKQYVWALNSGVHIASFSGNVHSVVTGSGYFTTGVNYCYGSGGNNLFTYSSSSGLVAGMSGSGWGITDLINSNNYAFGPTGSSSDAVLITHSFRIFYNSGELTRFNYDELYQKSRPSYTTGETVDTSYYSGFYMQGVSQNNYYYNSILLGDITGAPPTGVNILGKYNQVSGLFNVLEQSGYYYYNGIRASGTGISKFGEYVDILSVTEIDSDELIYDLYSGLRLQFFGLQGFATGEFFPRTPTPYTGVNSYSPMYRNLPNDYHETCKLHMFHGQPVLYQGSGNKFDNLEDYWF